MIKNALLPKACMMVISLLFLISGIKAQERFSTAPGIATVLFDGSDFLQWTNCDDGEVGWIIVDGAMEIVPDKQYSCERIQGIKTRKN